MDRERSETPHTPPQMSRIGAILFALPFLAAGGLVVAAALGYVPGKMNPPRWVVGAAGFAFVFAGALVLFQSLPVSDGFRRLATLLLLLSFAAPFNWAAFGPDERHFKIATTVRAASRSGGGSETSGRIAFGIGAALIDTILVAFALSALRRRRAEDGPRVPRA